MPLVTVHGETEVVSTNRMVAVNPLNQLLRQNRLDQLAQSFNILKGEMRWVNLRLCLLF